MQFFILIQNAKKWTYIAGNNKKSDDQIRHLNESFNYSHFDINPFLIFNWLVNC